MTVTTTAAVLENAAQPFVLREVQLDDLRDHEALVRIAAAGLCHTDLSAQAGHIPLTLPCVLGHEGAGTVEAVGRAVDTLSAGDRVALSFNSCGACRQCEDGHPAYCETWLPINIFNGGVRSDGSSTLTRGELPIGGRFFGQSSFSTRAIVDERSIVKIPEDLPFALAAPLGCGVQTGAGTVWNILRPAAGSTFGVFGTGAVGLAAIMAAALTEPHAIVAVDRVDSRLSLAAELGATHTLNPDRDDIAAELAQITGRGLDFAIDTTANMEVLRVAVEALATLGTAAAVGAAAVGTELTIGYQDMLVGRKIVGVTEGDSDPRSFIPLLAERYRAGTFPIDRLVTTYPFAEINQAAADALVGTVVKPVLLFD